jgi:hypothetical protein
VRFRYAFELNNARSLILKFGFMRLAAKLTSAGGLKIGHTMARPRGRL